MAPGSASVTVPRGLGREGGHRAALAESTEMLVARACSGDGDAVDALYRRHYGPTCKLLSRMYPGIDTDLVQGAVDDAFLTAIRVMQERGVMSNLPGFLHVAGRNAMREQWRRLDRRAPESLPIADVDAEGMPDEGLVDPAAIVAGRELRTRLNAAICALPERQRAVAVMRWICDYSISEVATELEMSQATVRVHLARARQRLAQVLASESHADASTDPPKARISGTDG